MSARPGAGRRGVRPQPPPAGGDTPAPAPNAHRGFASRIVRWQRRHGRQGLPWLGERDPYRVWLSETMLQQTQVGTVLGYYARFVERFPDIACLAAAPLDEVLALWSGLGYYSRARHLHQCARLLVAGHGGAFPQRSEELARLPGIGRSTAAAIAAFCFAERVAILDGNVKRVLARAIGFRGDLSAGPAQDALWAEAQALLPSPRTIGAYTQGLMDLGATVCLARNPDCPRCPLARICVARAEGSPEVYPVKTRRTRRTRRESWLLWLEHRGRWWLVRRPGRGVWAGLWSLPEFDSPQALAAISSGWPGCGLGQPPIEHALTHFDWTLHPLRWHWPARRRPPRLEPAGAGAWLTPEAALASGLPAPLRRLFLAAAPALR